MNFEPDRHIPVEPTRRPPLRYERERYEREEHARTMLWGVLVGAGALSGVGWVLTWCGC